MRSQALLAVLQLAVLSWQVQAFIPSFLLPTRGMPFSRSSLLSQDKAMTSVNPRPTRSGMVVMMSQPRPSSNQMSQEAYTEKAWDAITRLPQLASRYESQFVDTEHLLKALLDEGPGGLANRIFFKAGAQTSKLETDLDNFLQSQPKVSDPSNKVMGNTLQRSLDAAFKERDRMGDQYVSVEHLILGLLKEDTRYLKAAMTKLNMSEQKIREAITAIRGNRNVMSRTPEAAYDALEQYSRDLTQAAKEGKLDPVIGRDDEIRRTIQILSRRTKNNPILLGEPGVGKTAIAGEWSKTEIIYYI